MDYYDDDEMSAYSVEYQDNGMIEDEFDFFEELPEKEESQFVAGYSDFERAGGSLFDETPEGLYLFNLSELLRGRKPFLLEYIPLVEKVPRYWLKNTETMAAAIEIIHFLNINNVKPTIDNIKTQLKIHARDYSTQESDVYRYYKLLK